MPYTLRLCTDQRICNSREIRQVRLLDLKADFGVTTIR